MSHTLLDGVNFILTRVNINAGNAMALTSLTDSARQHNIDVSIQVINEGIDELYSASNKSLPTGSAESSIVLALNTREYALASNLITLKWPFADRTNTQYIAEWSDSYEDFLLLDPEQDQTGLPIWGIISPITGNFRVDRAPDSTIVGRTYFYEYEKNMALANATDAMPFNDACFRAMVPAWVQLYKREIRNEFDQPLFAQAIGRASRFVTELKGRTHYSPRG